MRKKKTEKENKGSKKQNKRCFTNLGVKHGGSQGASQHPSHIEQQEPPPLVHHFQWNPNKECHHHIGQQVKVSVGSSSIR